MLKLSNKLKNKLKFCTGCVNSNLRPRLSFNQAGLCDACQYAFKKQ